MTIGDHEAALVPRVAHLGPGAVAHQPAPALVEPGFADLERGIDWRRVLGAVRRFKWLILSVTLLGVAAGVVASRFAKPEYLARATIWIDQADREANRPDVDRGPIRQGHLLEPEAWVDLLQSYVVLDQVVRDQRLFLTVPLPADTAVVAARIPHPTEAVADTAADSAGD